MSPSLGLPPLFPFRAPVCSALLCTLNPHFLRAPAALFLFCLLCVSSPRIPGRRMFSRCSFWMWFGGWSCTIWNRECGGNWSTWHTRFVPTTVRPVPLHICDCVSMPSTPWRSLEVKGPAQLAGQLPRDARYRRVFRLRRASSSSMAPAHRRDSRVSISNFCSIQHCVKLKVSLRATHSSSRRVHADCRARSHRVTGMQSLPTKS